MKKVMTAAFALSALFASSGKVHAEVNYPWCIIGDTRAIDCYFSTREQCMQDGSNRGFGSQCIKNPFYKPGKPTVSGPVNKRAVSQTVRPSLAPSAAATCTGLKLACLSDIADRSRARTGGYPGPFITGSCTYEAGRSYCERECNFYWEHCIETGWFATSRAAERR
jgi:Protein of unknown function (DUF3551)